MTYDDLILELQTALADLHASHADLEARIERMFRKGKVTDVDPQKLLYRQEVGVDDDGNPVKSPWISYSQIAGARKVHSMPSVGEQYMMLAPDGDHTQALGIPHGWSDANPSPSTDPAADVSVRGNVTSIIKDGSHSLSVGLTAVVMDASGLVSQAEKTIAQVAKKILMNC